MKANRRYLLAVVLLAVLAVVFGLVGTVAPLASESVYPEQSSSPSSSSVTHFVNPPTFDSGWVSIRDKTGRHFNITHNLDTTEVFIDITGKRSLSGTAGEHQWNLGGTGINPGWSYIYGESSTLFGCMVQTYDGGYALTGNGLWYAQLIKTDSNGKMLWSRTCEGGSNDDYAYSLVQTSDEGYAIAGCSSFYDPNGGFWDEDFWLVKTDALGNTQWNKTYSAGFRYSDCAWSLVQTGDGGYALAGKSIYYYGGGGFWLVKTDAAGTLQWSRTYDEGAVEEAYSLVQTTDGGYALAGITQTDGDSDIWLVKTDASGNMQWNKTYGSGGPDDRAYSLVQTYEGGYALAGFTTSASPAGLYDFWLVKTDSLGSMQWNRTYGGTDDDLAYSMVQTSDGGYAIAGNGHGDGGFGFLLVKTDAAGNMQWSRTWNEGHSARSLVQTGDGGYALAGYPVAGDPLLLVKHGTDVGLTWTNSTNSNITLYRGKDDVNWNYVRVRIWTIKEPSWIYGDINMDGIVDAKDLYIIGRNYGKTFSLLSLGGIVAIAGIRTVKKRKQNS